MKLTLKDSTERFKEKFKISGEQTKKCGATIPGGYSRHTFNYGPHAIFIERGEGQYIFTIDGHRLLDLNNNFTVNVLGHGHPKIASALSEAIADGWSFGNPIQYELQLAQMICERIEAVERVKFSCSASESCLSAIRIARGNTGKNKIAKFEGGYHGFLDALAISTHPSFDKHPGPSTHPLPLPDSAGIPNNTIENVIVLPQNDLESCEKILRENAHDVACVIMELQSGAGGVIVLDKEFVHGIRALTQELGMLMIVDETITLRAGYHGLQGIYKVQPDLVVMGKIIGGGLPLGAVGGRAEYFHMVENGQISLSGTHHGHPLSTRAGIACLEVMDKAAYDRLNTLADRIKNELNGWSEKRNYPFQVYGEFSFMGYAFTDKPGRELRAHRDLMTFIYEEHMQTLALEMATRGFFPVHRGQLSLSVPMTDEDIDGFITTSKDIIEGMLGQ